MLRLTQLIVILIFSTTIFSDLWIERKDEEFQDLAQKTQNFLAVDSEIEMLDKGKHHNFSQKRFYPIKTK